MSSRIQFLINQPLYNPDNLWSLRDIFKPFVGLNLHPLKLDQDPDLNPNKNRTLFLKVLKAKELTKIESSSKYFRNLKFSQ